MYRGGNIQEVAHLQNQNNLVTESLNVHLKIKTNGHKYPNNNCFMMRLLADMTWRNVQTSATRGSTLYVCSAILNYNPDVNRRNKSRMGMYARNGHT